MSSISKDVLSSIEGVSGDGNNRVRVEFRRFDLPSRWFLALLVVPMLIALGISAYLTYVSVTASEIAGCSGGELFDCSHVIYSKWSKVFGFPVSGLAFLTYIGMLAATAVTLSSRFSMPTRLLSLSAVTGLAIAAALASLYFIFLQVFVLKHLCQWCLGAHTCGLIIASAVLFCRSRIALPPLGAVSGLAAAGLALMVGIQVNSKEPPKYEFIEYVPEVKKSIAATESEGAEQTFTASPGENEQVEDDMMLPPGEDDLFAPPVDEDFMEPPTEDTDYEADTSFIVPVQLENSLAFATQLIWPASSIAAAMVIQEPAQEQKQGEAKAAEQNAEKPKAKQKKPAKKKKLRVVEFMGRKINAYQWPIDGNPNAKHVFVEMFDYTCPHCRTTSKALFKVKEKMGDDLSVVVLPVPMNTRCNPVVKRDHATHAQACELSNLAVAVWRCDAKKFSEFHKWMFEGNSAPEYGVALGKAIELVGKEPIEAELNKKTAAAFVQSHCKMYQLLNGGPVPKLLFPTRAIQGEFTAVEELTKMIRENAISPQQTAAE